MTKKMQMQRHAYDTFLTWCRNTIKNLNSLKPGGGAAGKSHLIKTIYHTAVKTFRHPPINPELPTLLLMAPTGVAAINIGGTTINTALAIPKQTGDNLPAMLDQKKTQLRRSLTDLKLTIIDEISMVGNTTLLHIHQKLKQIFGTASSLLFGGISIIAVGDLCQLPPIRKRFVFDSYKNQLFNLMHPWNVLKMLELTQIMRQKHDQLFIQLLNRVRIGTQTEDDIRVMESRSITPDDPNYPSDALHIWAENTPVDDHNKKKLEEIPGFMYILKAKDKYPPNVQKQDIDRVLARGRSETGGLDYEICVKEGARVMLTTNICIPDRLINGQMGTVVRVHTNQTTHTPTVLYIKFDDPNAGKELIKSQGMPFARQNHLVPIKPVLTKVKVRPGKSSSPEIQRVQFPVTLAWACTIHKVQGLTLHKVVFSTQLIKQRAFNYGQIYVALSRATSLAG
jgi:ATP-dependent exoDNAse (exonuclease V) alpha subunit